ncbi:MULTISPECIES: hypothetical protein [Methylobacterium]|uniref:hypothetical protein n=1 Tax=Methylobacterium TaxID=407 RepID=UPI0011CC4124|nr:MULTISPECIES: hypothetical protein [Methylobacterium]TXN47528.1 hypothetical protein FV233_04505 [Methylobacterium sp. WL7]
MLWAIQNGRGQIGRELQPEHRFSSNLVRREVPDQGGYHGDQRPARNRREQTEDRDQDDQRDGSVLGPLGIP